MFGDNNLETVENNNYSVIDRFTKCAKDFGDCGRNTYYKCVINLKRCKRDIKMRVHSCDDTMIIQDGTSHVGDRFTESFLDNNIDVYIAHYYCKTKSEFYNNKINTDAANKTFGNIDNIMKDRFNPLWNRNDIENLDVYNINRFKK